MVETTQDVPLPAHSGSRVGVLGSVVAFSLMAPFIVLLLFSFFRKDHLFGVFYHRGGAMMHALVLIGMIFLGTSGYAIAYIWKRRQLSHKLMRLPLFLAFAMLLLGSIGTKMSLLSSFAALQKAELSQEFKLFANYLTLTLPTENFAYIFLSFYAPLLALLFAAVSLRIGAKPKKWWRAGFGLVVTTAVWLGAYFTYKSLSPLLSQLIPALIGLLALSLALLPSYRTNKENTPTDGNHAVLLIVGLALLGLLSTTLAGDGFYLSSFANTIDSATHGMSPGLLATLLDLPHYPRIWSMSFMTMSGALLCALWLLLVGWPPHQSGKWLLSLLLFSGLTVAVLGSRSHNRSAMKSHSWELIKRQEAQKEALVVGIRSAPWTPSLRNTLLSVSTKQNYPVSTLHHLLLVAAPTYPLPSGMTLSIRDKGIYTYGKLAQALEKRRLPIKKRRLSQKGSIYLLPKVHARLFKQANIRKKITMFKFKGKISILAHPLTPFRTLAAALYSAHQAGYSKPTFVLFRLGQEQVGPMTRTLLKQRYQVPVQLSLKNPNAATPTQKGARHKRFFLVLKINDKGAILSRTKEATPNNSTAQKGLSPSPTKANQKPLWKELRLGGALKMQGLRKALGVYWKQSKVKQGRLLITATPQVPTYELLGACEAAMPLGLQPSKHPFNAKEKGKGPTVWLAPAHRNGTSWKRTR